MFFKIISIISSLTFLSRILGYARDLFIARFIGAGFISDAFFVSFKLPNLFRRLFAEGAMNSAFIPVVSGIKVNQGYKDANYFLSRILSIVFTFLLPLIILFEIFMPVVISIVAPGFGDLDQKFNLTVNFSRLTFPFLIFICLSSLIGGYLNTMSKFAAMAFTPVILNITMLLSLFISFHNDLDQSLIARNLAFSISVAGLVQLIWLIYNLKINNIKLEFGQLNFLKNFKIDRNIKRFLFLFLPAVIGNGVYQLNLLIDMILASTLTDGSISYLYFADRINQLPLGVFGIAISTALLPILAEQIKKNFFLKANLTINYCLQIGLVISIPSSFGIFTLAEHIINVLFVRGEFTYNDSKSTSDALKALCLGLPAFIFVKILSVVFFAREDTKTPVYIALAAMSVNLIFNLILIEFFFHVGLAMATTIAAWFNFFLLLFILKRKNILKLSKSTYIILFKSIFSSLVMFLSINFLLTNNFFMLNYEEVFILNIFKLLTVIFLGSFIYIILIYFLKLSYLLKFKLGEENQQK